MRRKWIKLYVEQCLRGSMIEELTAAQRWLWIGLLLMAGDSMIPGVIYRRKDADGKPTGYSPITLAETLDVELAEVEDGLRRMVDKEKISIDEAKVITILNWPKYQSEYQRQKPYIERKKSSYKKIYNKSYSLDLDLEGDRDLEKDISALASVVGKVIDYFNEVTGQRRKSDIGGFIQARIAEGRTFEDFKHVIDTKHAQWSSDERMVAFIRPSTLFRPRHFDDYLNEPYQSVKPKAKKTERAKREAEREKKIEEYAATIDPKTPFEERSKLIEKFASSLLKEMK